jgi:hypothetical protein
VQLCCIYDVARALRVVRLDAHHLLVVDRIFLFCPLLPLVLCSMSLVKLGDIYINWTVLLLLDSMKDLYLELGC